MTKMFSNCGRGELAGYERISTEVFIVFSHFRWSRVWPTWSEEQNIGEGGRWWCGGEGGGGVGVVWGGCQGHQNCREGGYSLSSGNTGIPGGNLASFFIPTRVVKKGNIKLYLVNMY